MSNKTEKTLVVLKPDTVQRNLIGDIITRFERAGLKIIAMKFLLPTKEMAYKHYVKSEDEIVALGNRSIEGNRKRGIELTEDPKVIGARIMDRLVKYLAHSPVVAMVLEGNNSIQIVRKLVGSTEPTSSDVGTIRGDYTIDSYDLADGDDRAIRNLVHASANEVDANYEIPVWFNENEIYMYKNVRDAVLYDDRFN
jgi:nucleoside-diphosphate kinase